MKKLIIFLLPALIFAYVNVSVNKKEVYPGEEVVFTIQASGNSIKFPQIDKIEDFPVQGTAVTQSITILNGNMQKSVSKSYIFFPTKSVTIPSYKVMIDSKEYMTKPIKIKVIKPKESKNDNFKLKLSINKTTAHIGEPLIFKIRFFQKQTTAPQSIEIQKPQFNDFFTKQLGKKEYVKDGYDVTEYSFLLIPQKAGEYQIGPIMAKIGYLVKDSGFNDPIFNLVSSSLKYINIFSNSIKLKILPIPSSAVYGNFKASFYADKTETKANEPVKVTLNITGCGDFYDLPDFKLNIQNATVYENAPKIKTYLKGNTLCGNYKKEFTVISEKDVKISSVKFKAFDGNKTETVQTNSLFIKITDAKNTNPAPVVKKIKEKIIYKTQINYFLLGAVFLTGLLSGLLIANLLKFKTKNDDDIIKKIKKADEKELFNILLKFAYDPEIEKILKYLEENIYNGKQHPINKKEIIKIIKNLTKN